MSENIIQVKVNTPKGERVVDYKKVDVDYEDENLCATKCPYGSCGKCDNFRDPREPDDENLSFMAFCQEIDSTDLVVPDKSVNINFYVPVEETLEKNLGDILLQ